MPRCSLGVNAGGDALEGSPVYSSFATSPAVEEEHSEIRGHFLVCILGLRSDDTSFDPPAIPTFPFFLSICRSPPSASSPSCRSRFGWPRPPPT